MRSNEAPSRHTRRLLAGIHPNALEDGFPIENVGNDGTSKKRNGQSFFVSLAFFFSLFTSCQHALNLSLNGRLHF